MRIERLATLVLIALGIAVLCFVANILVMGDVFGWWSL